MTDQIMGLGVVGTTALILIIAAIVNILRNVVQQPLAYNQYEVCEKSFEYLEEVGE